MRKHELAIATLNSRTNEAIAAAAAYNATSASHNMQTTLVNAATAGITQGLSVNSVLALADGLMDGHPAKAATLPPANRGVQEMRTGLDAQVNASFSSDREMVDLSAPANPQVRPETIANAGTPELMVPLPFTDPSENIANAA